MERLATNHEDLNCVDLQRRDDSVAAKLKNGVKFPHSLISRTVQRQRLVVRRCHDVMQPSLSRNVDRISRLHSAIVFHFTRCENAGNLMLPGRKMEMLGMVYIVCSCFWGSSYTLEPHRRWEAHKFQTSKTDNIPVHISIVHHERLVSTPQRHLLRPSL